MSILQKYSTSFYALITSLLLVTLAACSSGNANNDDDQTLSVGPSITSSAPASGSVGVGTNVKVVVVFNGAMNSETLSQSSFTLQGVGETAIVGEVIYSADTLTATLIPNATLTPNTLYTATITTEVEGESGIALPTNVLWTFTTGSSADTDAPSVVSTSPADEAVDVVRNTIVNVVFSEAMDPATLTASSFKLTKDADDSEVTGSLRYINTTTVVLSPSSALDQTAAYTLTLTDGLTDLAGNSLAQTTIGFTTGSAVSSSPAMVDLGTAQDYVILAKTGISTTGTTHITGDIAVSPESLTAITGFSETLDADGTFATSNLVTGKLLAADLTAPTPITLTTAVSDMETAYTNAAGRTDPDFNELGAGEIGGLTLDPGLYKWGTGVLVTSDVTLNGSPTDVWIFQIGQDLKLEDGKAVVLTGGALPENVFWQVAGEVTLQAGAKFNGNILSQTGIVLKSGATLNGRAMAQTAVTLISNEVNKPTQ
ncbi:MAG: ice-binding family protein [Saccharospirillum sp.]|nr:ice-binding family protein [Saccharospirillum sp.]